MDGIIKNYQLNLKKKGIPINCLVTQSQTIEIPPPKGYEKLSIKN